MTDRTNVTPSRRALLRGAALTSVAAVALGTTEAIAQAITTTDPAFAMARRWWDGLAALQAFQRDGFSAAEQANVDEAMAEKDEAKREAIFAKFEPRKARETALLMAWCSVERKLVTTAATTEAGVLAKVAVAAAIIGDAHLDSEPEDAAHRIVLGAGRDIERLAGKAVLA